jgi:hypothetical protein
MNTSQKSFNPIPYVCKDCHTKLQSTYSGEFVTCACGNSFVDQTTHYMRIGGNAIPMKENK